MDFHHQKISSAMDLEDVMRVLYPSQSKYRVAGAVLISELIKKEHLDGYELSLICKKNSISRATMQKVFVRLRALGMIERRMMRYYLNKEFSTAMRRMGEAWKNIINEKKHEFNINIIKSNLR